MWIPRAGAALYARRTTSFTPPWMPLRPFQFPSLQHLDARVEAMCATGQKVEGLSDKTTLAWRGAYARLRAYLRHFDERAFLAGDVQTQVRLLTAWIGWLREAGANHTTVNTYWRSLRSLLARIGRDDGLIDPSAFIEPPRPGRPAVRFLPRDALEEVFGFVRHFQWKGGEFERLRNVALLATMALGGCRLGEVLRLKVGDVRLADAAILVRHAKGVNGGKYRTVYMPPALAHAMAEYLGVRERRQLITPFVFASSRQDRPIPYIGVRRLCAFVSARTGIRFSPHMLRHTCATLLRQSGVSDRLAMEQLGHSSLLALQRYSHVVNGELHEEVRKVQVNLG